MKLTHRQRAILGPRCDCRASEQADPNELVNRSGRSEYRRTDIPLREKPCRWRIETNDPVLTHAIEPPVEDYDPFHGHRDAGNEHAKCWWEMSSPCFR